MNTRTVTIVLERLEAAEPTTIVRENTTICRATLRLRYGRTTDHRRWWACPVRS